MSYVAAGTPPTRRVRHQARDALAVMAFSAATSALLCGLLVLALAMLGQG